MWMASKEGLNKKMADGSITGLSGKRELPYSEAVSSWILELGQ